MSESALQICKTRFLSAHGKRKVGIHVIVWMIVMREVECFKCSEDEPPYGLLLAPDLTTVKLPATVVVAQSCTCVSFSDAGPLCAIIHLILQARIWSSAACQAWVCLLGSLPCSILCLDSQTTQWYWMSLTKSTSSLSEHLC